MALGQRLVELAGPRRDALSLPDEVREAVEEALRMRSHAARKRQMLFLGKVLRNCDELDDIATALDEISEQDRRGTLAFQRVESWRERLLHEGEPALDAFCALYPAAARAELLALMQEAGRGRDHPRGAGAARALFRALRSQLASAAPKA